MRIVGVTFGFLSRFTQWSRAVWNLAACNGAFRQIFSGYAVARLSLGCLLTIALALGGFSCGTAFSRL
jgi:hypothetical protein